MIAMAVARHLATLPGLTLDENGPAGNVFAGMMPSAPDVAVSVMPTGGAPQLTLDPSDAPTVQVLVRGARNDTRGPYTLARAVYGALTGLDLTTLDEGGPDEVFVIGSTALQSDPVPLGQDPNQRHEYSLNFQFHTHAPTAHRN